MRATRLIAIFLLALLLPVQGLAAACAQICALASAQGHLAPQASSEAGHHCDEPADAGTSASKCCNAHTFMTEASLSATAVVPPALDPVALCARWTSFIPDAASPPPIPA